MCVQELFAKQYIEYYLFIIYIKVINPQVPLARLVWSKITVKVKCVLIDKIVHTLKKKHNKNIRFFVCLF